MTIGPHDGESIVMQADDPEEAVAFDGLAELRSDVIRFGTRRPEQERHIIGDLEYFVRRDIDRACCHPDGHYPSPERRGMIVEFGREKKGIIVRTMMP